MNQCRRAFIASRGSWIAALGFAVGVSACGAKPGQSRCDPAVDRCDTTSTGGVGATGASGATGATAATGATTSVTTTGGPGGNGGAGGAGLARPAGTGGAAGAPPMRKLTRRPVRYPPDRARGAQTCATHI